MAISKVQLMYFIQDENYLNLINAYSKLSDSYYKLVKLEKINNVPLTIKPAILTLIDKLFINHVTNDTVKDYEDDYEDKDDLTNYTNNFENNPEPEINYVEQKETPKKSIKVELPQVFHGLKFPKNNTNIEEEKTVVFDMKGQKIE